MPLSPFGAVSAPSAGIQIRALVHLQDGARCSPPAQVGEILERHAAVVVGELPPQTMPAETVGVIHPTPFSRATWGRVDSNTGRITHRREPTPEGIEICPGPAGAKEWPHAAYHPEHELFYVPLVELCAALSTSASDEEEEFEEGMPFFGSMKRPLRGDQWGGVKAIEARTGEVAWEYRTDYRLVASMLATAGNVVFAGEPTGRFTALDARTGERLWQFRTGSGIHSSPVTYSVEGKQYVAVPVGWGGWLEGFDPDLYGQPRGDAIFVFSLP